MDKIGPWKEMTEVIEPYYPKPKEAGRRPVGLERMLRTYFLQHCFELSDAAVEETCYDSRAMCDIIGIDLSEQPVPDETTILNHRHLREKHSLGDELFRRVNIYLAEQGVNLNRDNNMLIDQSCLRQVV
jgi:IS5 family transposase